VSTFRVETLGCKVSRADAALVERSLVAAGLRPAGDGERARLCVVCGCAVTGVAEGKSRRALTRIRRENPDAVVVAAGCIAARLGEPDGAPRGRADGAGRAKAVRPQVDVALPPERAGEIVAALERTGHIDLLRAAADGIAPGAAVSGARTRAVLKVQDGCDWGCSYCIVHRLRGPMRSRPIADVLDEARKLVDEGHPELVLAGIRLGSYRDASRAPAGGIAALVRGLLSLCERGLVRVRLSSIEPVDFDLELAAIAASDAGLCPHFHLPLQSADDEVLAAMNRPYRRAEYGRLLDEVRARVPDVAITTDLIAGFPGESAEAHRRTVEFVACAGFARVHAFPFSPRPGTPAAAMDGQVPVGEARRRARQLIAAGARSARAYHATFVGTALAVIVEPGDADGQLAGYSERYARVRFRGPAGLVGTVQRVRAVSQETHGFAGELLL
jgi:threonylcarbamoyladenosine tRNA methylthiotransferase MtaB